MDYKRTIKAFCTISIHINRTGVSFSIVVGVGLSRVVFIWAVVTTVSDIILVIVILPGVIHQGAVVLEEIYNLGLHESI